MRDHKYIIKEKFMQERCYQGEKAPGENGLHIFCQHQNYVKDKAVLCKRSI